MANLAEARAEQRLRNQIIINEEGIDACVDYLTEPIYIRCAKHK